MSAPPADRHDVVVIGSGHNALIAACYLARAGLAVCVLEGDTVVGGAVSTVQRFPGYRMDRGSSAHVMIRGTGIVEDLGLPDLGLRYLDCDPWAFHPVPGAPGGGLTFWRSVPDTCASIAAVCGDADADAYARFVATWAARNAAVFDALAGAPSALRLAQAGRRLGRPDPAPPARDTGSAPGGRHGRGRGGRGSGAELARQFLGPADQLLDEWFTSEHLKAALAWLGAQSGPPTHEVGTANLVGWGTVLHTLTPGHPVGGSGALTAALAARLVQLGGELRTGDPVTEVTGSVGRATGVQTRSGSRLAARAVLAGCHVLTTARLARTVLGAGVGADWERRVRVGAGIGMAVRVACRDLPRYPGAGPDSWRGLQLLAPDRALLRSAYGDYLAGRPPATPAALAMTFSAADPSLAPPGRHVMTVWGQWHRYQLTGTDWAHAAPAAADALIAAVDRAAPGFAAGVDQVHVQSPTDLADELGLLGGNVMHVEMGLDAMFALRPLPELAGYRTPATGLYLTGASTHPGGGVFGASGRAAAAVLLRDLGVTAAARGLRRRRWAGAAPTTGPTTGATTGPVPAAPAAQAGRTTR